MSCVYPYQFSFYGFGNATLQPDSDATLLDTMQQEMQGGDCKFLKKEHPDLTLRPIASDPTEAVAMKFVSIPTWVKDLLVTGIGNTARECNSHWLPTAMQFDLFYQIMAIIQWFDICNCNWWWEICLWLIETTDGLSMVITGCTYKMIFSLTLHYNKMFLDLHKSNWPPTGTMKPKNMANYCQPHWSHKPAMDSSQQHSHFTDANSFFAQSSGNIQALMYHNLLTVILCQFVHSGKTQP